MNNVVIDTQNLQLRDFKQTDWQEVQEYSSDPEVVRFMEWGPNSREQTMDFVDRARESARKKPRLTYELAVILRAENKLIGAAGIRVAPYDNQQADLGYCYNRNYWGKGFATEACKSLIDFGFEKLNLHRIWATCDAENVGSATVLQKSGMRKEGHFVKDKNIKGRWRDTFLFAILCEEWSAHG